MRLSSHPSKSEPVPDAWSQTRFHGDRTSPLLWIFLIGLAVPSFINVADVRLSVYRIVLLISLIPSLSVWLSGRAGRLQSSDFLVFAICLWSTVSISVVHGFSSSLQTIGVFWIETCGAYFLGRAFVRKPDHFLAVAKAIFLLAMVLFPFAVFEALSGNNLILVIFSKFGPTYFDTNMDPRLGLQRVQGPFPHPIHFGVFFFSIIGITHYVFGHGKTMFSRFFGTVLVTTTGFFSLSSGPLVAAITQICLIVWDAVMRNVRTRWLIFSGLALLAFLTVDLLSNRTPFHVLIEYLAFNRETAYNRIQIWEFGTKNIFANPFVGLGFNDWSRPSWMSSSIDMFWIVGGIRHGILVWALWFVLFLSVFLPVVLRKLVSPTLSNYRVGYVISLVGFFMAGWTVHYWDTTYVYFLFFLGAGSVFLDACNDVSEVDGSDDVLTVQYTRFTGLKPRLGNL